MYDDLTRMASRTLGVPIAMVNLLDADRDWFKSCLGLPMSESPATTSFCEVVFTESADLIVVEDTTKDSRFSQHPLVVGAPLIRFYAAARLTVRAQTVGTLCVYDTEPRYPAPDQIATFVSLSGAAMDLLSRRLERGTAPH